MISPRVPACGGEGDQRSCVVRRIEDDNRQNTLAP